MSVILGLANCLWFLLIIVLFTTSTRDGSQLFKLYVPSQLSAVVVRIGVIALQWAYTQKLSGLQFWSNRDKPFDDSPSPAVRDPGSPPPPTEKPTNRPDTFWAYPPPPLPEQQTQQSDTTNGSTSPHDIHVSVVGPEQQQQHQQSAVLPQPVVLQPVSPRLPPPLPPQRVSYGQPQQQVIYMAQQPAAVYGQPVVLVAQPGHTVVTLAHR